MFPFEKLTPETRTLEAVVWEMSNLDVMDSEVKREFEEIPELYDFDIVAWQLADSNYGVNATVYFQKQLFNGDILTFEVYKSQHDYSLYRGEITDANGNVLDSGDWYMEDYSFAEVVTWMKEKIESGDQLRAF